MGLTQVSVKPNGLLLRRCLIISPYFPPSTLAGVHRARHLVKHLPAHGWEPTVVCVDPAHHIEPLDPGLRALVPALAHVVQTGAISMRLTAPFGLRGDLGLRGLLHLRAAVAQQIQTARPKAVLITGSPFFPMLLSRWISRKFGVPVMLDFQDPWASNEGAGRARWTKGWLAHRLAVVLEPRALAAASWVTSVSARQNLELLQRYSWLDPARMSAIPIGGDPDDFISVRAATQVARAVDPGLLTFSYVGTALPRADPLLAVLFEAVAQLRTKQPQLASRIRLRFVGTSNQPAGTGAYRALPLARAADVADQVTEEPARVPFLDALRILASTHAVLMIGSDEPHYTASKIYPALMSGRPFLSIFHESSSAHEILAGAGGGAAVAWSEARPRAAMVAVVAEALGRLVSDASTFGTVDPSAYAQFTAHAVAGQFAEAFEGMAK